MGVKVTFPPGKDKISVRLYGANKTMPSKLQTYMRRKSKEIEVFMKSNHPWRNRTGAAERGLKANLQVSAKKYSQSIALSHGVYYGIYLEKGFGGIYAIIEPTIRIKGPDIVRDAHQLWTDVMVGP